MPYIAQWSKEDTLSRADIDALDGTTLVEFGVDWCPHCQAIQEDLKQMLKKRPGLRHLKVEDGKGRPLGRSFGVKVWPNFVLMENGKVQKQLARPEKTDLENALQTAD